MSNQKILHCGLLGEKLSHSYSKEIHSFLGNYSYDLLEVPQSRLETFVKSRELDGYNVTVPYKKEIMPYLDEISAEALEIGAVNTVVQKEGKLFGYNTDCYGFLTMLRRFPVSLSDKKVLILGKGGAAATVSYVCKKEGASSVVMLGSKDNREELLKKYENTEILINCTPVGMFPDSDRSPVSPDYFPNLLGVLDVIYNPKCTKLLFDAQKRGLPTANGLSMLISQAMKASSLFLYGKETETVPNEESLLLKIEKSLSRSLENIVLVGMPGSGKTAVGQCLARLLHQPFFDADAAFEETYKESPASFITTKGEQAFRKEESKVLENLCRNKGVVIATGGGAVTFPENEWILKKNARIFEIERDLALLDLSNRPLSTSVKELYEKRKPLYTLFSERSFSNEKTPEDTAKNIADAL